MKASNIIHIMAVNHGVSEEQIFKDLQEAIRIGSGCADPHTQQIWNQISTNGSLPTPEQLIDYFIREIRKCGRF